MSAKDNNTIEHDPFYLSYGKWSDYSIMQPHITSIYTGQANDLLAFPRDTASPTMIADARGWTRKQEKRRSRVTRFWFGLAGGLASIVPMVIVILHRDRNTALVTAAVAMLLFAMTMAYYSGKDTSPFKLVGATAAYAAVLVVLVSTAL